MPTLAGRIVPYVGIIPEKCSLARKILNPVDTKFAVNVSLEKAL
jgi:hypothetical protein